MAEVQSHGNSFEDVVIQERTGLSKKDYDKLKKNGYTSEFDLSSGLIVDYNASIKTTGSNTVCCSDILRMISHTESYRLIIGCYQQVDSQKIFRSQYEFFIRPENYSFLWGNLNYDDVERYVNKIKSVQKGKQGQQEYQLVAESWKGELNTVNSMFIINPKVDSKSQRRVQCSIKLDDLLSSSIEYEKRSIDMAIKSSRRTFNK